MDWTDRIIKARRIEKGLTQQQLADAIGVSRSVITKWENGERVASGTSIRGLERILGATEPDRSLEIGDATEVELLTELLSRRLRAGRSTHDMSDIELPKRNLEWVDPSDDAGANPGARDQEEG